MSHPKLSFSFTSLAVFPILILCLTLVAFLVSSASSSPDTPAPTATVSATLLPLNNELLPPATTCIRAGCSGQLCVDTNFGLDNFVTTCQWQPSYACYQAAPCEVQADGRCGFTPSQTLTDCLHQTPDPSSPPIIY